MSFNSDVNFADRIIRPASAADETSSSVPATVQNQNSHASIAGTLTYSRNGSEVERAFEPLTTALLASFDQCQLGDENAHTTAGKVVRSVGQALLAIATFCLGGFFISLAIDAVRYAAFKKGVINGKLNQTVQKVLNKLNPEINIVKASAQRIEAAAYAYGREMEGKDRDAVRAKNNLQKAVDREVARLKPFLKHDETIVQSLCDEIRDRLKGLLLMKQAGNLSEDNVLDLAKIVIEGNKSLGGTSLGFRGIEEQCKEYLESYSEIDTPLDTARLSKMNFKVISDDPEADSRLFPSLGRSGRVPSFGLLHDSYARQFSNGPRSLHSESEILDSELDEEASFVETPEDRALLAQLKEQQAQVDAFASARNEENDSVGAFLGKINLTEPNSGSSANPIAKPSKAEKQAQFDARLDVLIKGYEADKVKLNELRDVASGAVELSRKLSGALSEQERLFASLREAISDAEGEFVRESIHQLLSPPENLFTSASLNAKAKAKLSGSARQQNPEKVVIRNTWREIQELNEKISEIYEQDLSLRDHATDLFRSFIDGNSRNNEEAQRLTRAIQYNQRSEEFELLERETNILFKNVALQFEMLSTFQEENDLAVEQNLQTYQGILNFTTTPSKEKEALAAKKADAFIDEALPTEDDEYLLDEDAPSVIELASVTSGEDVDAWLNLSVRVKDQASSQGDARSVSDSQSIASQENIDEILDAANPEDGDEELLNEAEVDPTQAFASYVPQPLSPKERQDDLQHAVLDRPKVARKPRKATRATVKAFVNQDDQRPASLGPRLPSPQSRNISDAANRSAGYYLSERLAKLSPANLFRVMSRKTPQN